VLWWELCCACVVGAFTCVVTHLVLWRLSGAPLSAERYALRVASGLVHRFWSHRGSGCARVPSTRHYSNLPSRPSGTASVH
jgi:hypothetical protein